jgi:hypothetical protein
MWLVDNERIGGELPANGCVAGKGMVIDSNQLLTTGDHGVIRCEDCVIAGNQDIGSWSTHQKQAGIRGTAVRAEGWSLVIGNRITALAGDGRDHAARNSGLEIVGRGLVDGNVITLGCPSGGVTLASLDSSARVQNNELFGSSGCGGRANPIYGNVLVVDSAAVENELVFTSNHVHASVPDGPAPPYPEVSFSCAVCPRSLGVIRNNVMETAIMAIPYDGLGLWSAPPPFGARVVENNEFDFQDNPRGLPLFSSASGTVNDVAALNLLPIASGNRDDGLLVDTGTPATAPRWDFLRNPRDALPDIGPIEAPP